MKLENEHMVGLQTSPRKSYNPFDSDDEDTNAKSKFNGYDIKSFETTPDSLTFHLDSSNLSWEEAILGHPQILSQPISADASSEEVVYRKDTELFTDKKVTECELPELMFSYKDNGFHSVKDIGIDEGVPTHEKVWIISQDNSKNLSTVLASNDDVNGNVVFTNDVKKDPFVQDSTQDLVVESRLVHEVLERPFFAEKCGTDDLLKANEFEHDSSKKEKESNFSWQSTGDLVESGGLVNGQKDPQVGEKDGEICQKVDKSDNEVSEEEHCKANVPLENAEPSVMHEVEATMRSNEAQCVEESATQPSIMHEVEATMKFNESPIVEASSVQSVELPALQVPADSGITNVLSYNSKVESGSIILDFNAAATISEKVNEDNSEKSEAVEKPPVTQTMSREEGGTFPGGSILNRGTDNRVHGETSFSATMAPPASITYMGSNAHTGNISLRSESSAGSTRSFAFPVLQAEWNTSPVRMAKADQRHFSKQKGWVHSLVCCKF